MADAKSKLTYSSSALAVNRRGEITVGQVGALLLYWLNKAGSGFVVLLISSIFILIGMSVGIETPRSPFVVFLGVLGIYAGLKLLFWDYRGYLLDILKPKVAAREGQLRIVLHEGMYFAEFDEIRFQITVDQISYFSNEGNYRLYYLPRTDTFLSAEYAPESLFTA